MAGGMCVVIIVSADAEWQAVCELYPGIPLYSSPYGDWFPSQIDNIDLIFFNGGWGKIAAAGSTQYAIDRWQPLLIINIGTCGGFAGEVELDTILLVDRTIVYDIYEQMGDQESHIASYTTKLDLSWLGEPFPIPVRKGHLSSGDRDLNPQEISDLSQTYGALAGDWESGAIAYVAAHNSTRCLILRGVSDLVSEDGSDAYGNLDVFAGRARQIMSSLISSIPGWLQCAGLLVPDLCGFDDTSLRVSEEK